VPRRHDDEKVEVLSMSRTILGMGLNWPSLHVALVSPAYKLWGHGAPVPVPCHLNL
jgi:hypothetical protein